MIRKFHAACDAAEYAAAFTKQWTDDHGRLYDSKGVLGYMRVADESDPLDRDDLSAYYFVNSQGDIGFTSDDGETVTWVFRNAGARGSSRTTTKSERPKPMADPREPKAEATRTDRRAGYSPNINSPEFIDAVNKAKKSRSGCAKAIIAAPVVIIPIYTYFSDDAFGTGLIIGLVISAIFLVIYLVTLAKEKLEKPWEGVVVGMERKAKSHFFKLGKGEEKDNNKYWEEHDIITIKRDDGKTHKIDEVSSDPKSHSYNYLQIGDRVCYHANMGLQYPYEKFDKTHDEFVICSFCGNIELIKNTHCTHCKKLLLN